MQLWGFFGTLRTIENPASVTGTVEQVLVDDNWHVNAGQLLIKLDPHDYEVALARNRAQLNQAVAQVSQAKAGVEQANAELQQRQAQVTQAAAQVLQSQAAFDIAKINYDRDHSLFQKDLKAIAKQDVDTTKANLDSAQGALNAAKATQQAYVFHRRCPTGASGGKPIGSRRWSGWILG